MFAKHHYLSHSHHNAASVYVMTCNGDICGFCSVLHFPHPSAKNIKRGHRTVILPDFQGIGLGVYFRNFIADYYIAKGFRFRTTTSNPALINYMRKSKNWVCSNKGRLMATTTKTKCTVSQRKHVSGINRITTSWEYIKTT